MGVFYITSTLLFVTILAFAFIGPIDPRLRQRMLEHRAALKEPLTAAGTPRPADPDNLLLVRGRKVRLEGLRLIFYALENGRVHLAVTVLEMDPQVAYHHRIPLREARRGFRAGGRDFVLLAANRSRIRLRASPPQQPVD